MARYRITALNYLTSGKKHAFINVDTALEYEQPTKIKVLEDETLVSAITLDQGNIEYIDTEYIAKEEGKVPLSLAPLTQTIVLREDQKHIKNIEAQDKSVIILKTAEDVESTLSSLRAFQQETSAICNVTFELETAYNDSKNNLEQEETGAVQLPMYDVRNLAVKSANKKKMPNRLAETDEYVDLYAPSMESSPMKFCEANGYSYMLLEPTNSAPQYLNAYVNDSDDTSYYMQAASRQLKTYMYTPVDQLVDKYNEDTQLIGLDGKSFSTYGSFYAYTGYDVSAAMLGLFQPYSNYKNIPYNYILDFDQNKTSLKYDTGDIHAANINIAKNIYNSLYTIDMSDRDTINDTREYFTVGSMNNRVFLTYTDDIKYVATSRFREEGSDVIDVTVKKVQKTKRYYRNDETGEIVEDPDKKAD